jgi:hypothetical protein
MNELTPEVRVMYEKLQPKFREAMREWRSGDFGYDTECKWIIVYKCRFWHCPDWCLSFLVKDGSEVGMREEEALCILRLPLAINDRNPGRGLLGMIQGTGKYLCLNQGSKKWRFSVEQNDHDIATSYFGATPTEALLRALMAQEVK